jgi:homopolymeric O-antigen transport system permease protein
MLANEREEEWSQVIKPKGGLSVFNLRELWRYRDLILLFVKRDFIAVYKQTILGPAWHIIQPLLMTATYMVFGSILGVKYGALPRALFCMSGVIIWNYFSSCLTKTSNTFVGNSSMFGKVYFPRLCIPISVVISNMVSFLIQMGVLVLLFAYYRFVKHVPIEPNAMLLALPVIILFLAMLGLGFGLIVSALTVRYRDLVYLVNFGIGLAIYTAPVIYPLSMLKGKIVMICWANPVTPFIEMFRYSLLGSGVFSLSTIGYGALASVVILLLGMVAFGKVEHDFMDTV